VLNENHHVEETLERPNEEMSHSNSIVLVSDAHGGMGYTYKQ
jgi:hypothetical protein